MSNYSAGSLDLSILGYSDSAVLSITKTVRALNSLTNAITKMQGVNFGAQANKLTHFFDKMAKSTNAIDPAKLQMLASVASSFRGISSISKLDKMDYTKIATGFSQLTVAITPFVNKVKEAEVSLVALRGVLSASGRNSVATVLNGKAAVGGGLLGGIFKIGKIYRTIYWARLLGRAVAGIVQAGSDYLETMNLWQVAMRDNLDLADEFVNKMNKAYGISTKTVMQAQATFKNMIGSLGDLSSETAYQLSEAITMMALDYSSLYNVKLQSAVEKFQSALAGQVRPIRSVSGYDITEKTIHALYQSLGGTKTQRQLSRTEKQLLAILAVYKQMGASGALGDMSKTLNQFANQARMMTEYWVELKSWTGLVLKDLIDQWGVMVKINALLITVTEVMKAIAKSKGLGDENFIDGIFESAQDANNEFDELQGKLLDFDKFRSLSGQDEGASIAIDQVVLDAIAGYTSNIDSAVNAAEELAAQWLSILGFIKEANGEWSISESKLDDLTNAIEAITITAQVLLGYKLATWLLSVALGAKVSSVAFHLLSAAILLGGVYAILQAIDAFDRGDKVAGAFALTVGVVLVGAFIALNRKAILAVISSLHSLWQKMVVANITTNSLGLAIFRLSLQFVALAAVVGGAFLIFENWGDMGTAQRIAAVCGLVATAVIGLAMAMGAFQSAWSIGLAAAGIVAGITAIAASIATVKKEAKTPVEFAAVGASNLEGGTLFVAGEMGKTEAVYTGANGKTNVANVRQMEQAFYNALSRYGAEDGGKIVVEAYLDGEKVYQNTTAKARARGKVWANA